MKKLSLVALVAVIVVALFGLVGCSSKGSGDSVSESASAASVESAEPSSSSSASVEETFSLEDVELTPTTEFLEYSNKKTDPVKLVKCSEKDVTVSADKQLDLSKVGVQSVSYSLSIGEESATQDVQFTVRDTKAPIITFSNSKPSIDQGGSFDPSSSISSVADPIDGELAKVDSEPAAQGSEVGLEQFYDAGWYFVDGTVDSSTLGTHWLVVKASDKHGNVVTKELPVTVKEVAQESSGSDSAAEKHKYIKSVNSKVFHIEGCPHVDDIKEWNRREYYATRQEMLDMKFKPCEHCNP